MVIHPIPRLDQTGWHLFGFNDSAFLLRVFFTWSDVQSNSYLEPSAHGIKKTSLECSPSAMNFLFNSTHKATPCRNQKGWNCTVCKQFFEGKHLFSAKFSTVSPEGTSCYCGMVAKSCTSWCSILLSIGFYMFQPSFWWFIGFRWPIHRMIYLKVSHHRRPGHIVQEWRAAVARKTWDDDIPGAAVQSGVVEARKLSKPNTQK